MANAAADFMARDQFENFLHRNWQIAGQEKGADLDTRVDNFVLRFAGRPENVSAIWIGITTTGVDGCWDKWNDKYHPGALGMAHMAIVFETTSYNFATRVKARLIDTAYRRAAHYPEIQGGNQGLPVDGEHLYTVYAAWTQEPGYRQPELFDFQTAFDNQNDGITLHWNRERIGQLTGIVNTIPGFNRRTPFWIGITSDGRNGCRNRWNNKYKFHRMSHMRILYRTNSDPNCRDAERALIAHYKEIPRWNIQNRTDGGEGPLGGIPFVVYITWRIAAEPEQSRCTLA